MLGSVFVRKFLNTVKIVLLPWWVVLGLWWGIPVAAQPESPNGCPEELAPLWAKFLTDLPNYANRVLYRSRSGDREGGSHYILTAGKPEFDPLPLPSPQSDLADTRTRGTEEVRQVFFTTLERQYRNGRSRRLQQYHWAFLAPTSNGWRLIVMFSRTGGLSQESSNLTPVRNTSHSAIAEAIRLWLRDRCRY
ncbi:hypothetical protein [Geitlerinema sp. PCC 9228]|uniref:hypothetical protein n=1 Tax=Geitlerinema sp. PCC 9228 TaxID=111611 RepID=UPI0009FBD96B|nr:hypothetical protein [Geitlerinema sp. PCC 9228]